MAMNKELLKKIAEKIVERPKEFYMPTWTAGEVEDADDTSEECGTKACIAGHVCAEVGRFQEANRRNSWPSIAIEELGITWPQAERLFYSPHWPRQFWGGTTPEEKACLAAQRIKHFIDTDGRE